ncbi:neutral/alkaline non-lysosomal ceramidase N-terminal domain-containing protein [Frigoriglobus tundricola]|uniref:Beta-propeller-type glycoside hydrolase n=1 Tax=Frigoriglobus tundricola TaxID=2774151 RepID=A0A6M5Z7H3_9BACT|nr:neutral/alkaline non-lysosomal ceramidase N-terminal domain-containing protein [Frigoriglobus tundricola]QJX01301.1 beta-propeller-type glycoside hydrolase [Frigoriglobus tundricola]
MKPLLALVALFVLAGPVLAGAAPAFKAGVATKIITPTEPVWMAGYAARTRPADGKIHDLYAKALCLEDSTGKRIVLVTTDLIGIPRALGDLVAAEVEKAHGITRDELILSASHTHCGPVIRENLSDMYPLTIDDAVKVEAYTEQLRVALVAVIGASLKDRKPVDLKYGAGKATFATNRRESTAQGVVIGRNPAGPVDHTVPVLVAEGAGGKPVAIVFGYACHNTTLDGMQWCGDYAGFAQLAVEKAAPGAVGMFWTGCGGDANPNPRRKRELCEQHGKELAEAVTGALKAAQPITGTFATGYEKIALKFESVPTKQQLGADLLSKTLAVRRRAERLLKELEVGGKIADTYDHYPVQAWRLGDQVLLVALGGEVVIDYLLRLKKDVPTSRALWVMGYANDVMAYIPSARVLKEGGYEADSSQIYYGMPGKWSPAIEDAITGKAKELATRVSELPKPPGPLSPKEERDSFRPPDGFQIDLVACEPAVVDPVAMCFDAKGRLFVCEMRGYPNGGVGTGPETRGKVKCLVDKDGDGVYETVTTFAEGLRFPMGITPYKNGVIVAVAPDLVYLEDTDGDGRADKTTVLYTGFNQANIQQMVNGLQWGMDNWIYGIAGSDGGTVTSPQTPKMAAVVLRNRGFRFKPWEPGGLEPTSSGGQYGLSADDYQHWFTATNSQHLRQIVLPDHYLKRNPYLAVPTVTLDIPEHGAAAKVFRISPFEPWRVERTTRRAGSPDARRFPTTELVPGGYITSACSPLIYTAGAFPREFHGNNFVCDPANNIVHCERLTDKGAVFSAARAYADREFLASTDTWFRPVHLSTGPDGALYVLDFYREVIETPLSLPEDIKRQLNLESRGRGRIWRIAPKDLVPPKGLDLSALNTTQRVDELAASNSWRRLTAERLLIEKHDKGAAGPIRDRLPKAKGAPSLAALLWTLHGLGELQAADLKVAYSDPEAGNREQALRLSEAFFKTVPEVRAQAAKLVDDPAPRVRFQLALSAGALPPADAAPLVTAVLESDAGDPWTVTAALSSAGECGFQVLGALTTAGRRPSPLIVARLATMVGAKGDPKEIAGVLELVAEARAAGAEPALLDGLGQGMRGSKLPLAAWWAAPPAEAAPAMPKLRERFAAAASVVRNEKAELEERVRSAALLAYGPFGDAASLADALSPGTPNEVQLAIIKALAVHTDPKVADLLLNTWTGYGPAVRREALEALLARADRVLKLLDAVEAKKVAPSEFSLAQTQQLHAHPNTQVRTRAAAVLTRATDADRAKVVKSYAAALELKADAVRGKAVFKRSCAACHRLDGAGADVGANLLAALPNKSGADLLVAVFDPNREVDPRYVSYQVVTTDERVLTGIVAAETPTGITLRRADGKEDVILRANIASLRSTALSLMPVGLEKELTPQDVADLFAYLRAAGK